MIVNTVRDSVLEFFRDKDITTIFGNPGSTELPLFRNFPNDFRYVLGLQESVVVGMADGHAQVSDNATVVNLHSAAGVGHAMGAIFSAWCHRSPVIVIAGQQARSLLLQAPFLISERATELPQPYVKYAVEPARAEDVPMAIARAWVHAMQHPRGPVFVSVPVDDWDRPADPVLPRGTPIGPGASDVAPLANAFAASANPVLVIGGEVDRTNAWQSVVALAEKTGAPVWQAAMEGRIGFPQTHTNFAGVLPSYSDGVFAALADHDLVVAIGARTFTYHIEGDGAPLPSSTPVYLLSNDPQNGGSATTGQHLIGDIAATVEALLPRVPQSACPCSPRPRPEAAPASFGPIDMVSAVRMLAETRPLGSVIVEEAATTRPLVPDHMPVAQPASYFCCGSGGLGYGLPAAVGAALARPERRTIALIGDGSAMYTVQALYTAARERANVTFVVLNNRRYAALDDFGRLFGLFNPPGLDIHGLDFVGLATAQGVPADSVADAGDLRSALIRALQAEGPTLLEIRLRVEPGKGGEGPTTNS